MDGHAQITPAPWDLLRQSEVEFAVWCGPPFVGNDGDTARFRKAQKYSVRARSFRRVRGSVDIRCPTPEHVILHKVGKHGREELGFGQCSRELYRGDLGQDTIELLVQGQRPKLSFVKV